MSGARNFKTVGIVLALVTLLLLAVCVASCQSASPTKGEAPKGTNAQTETRASDETTGHVKLPIVTRPPEERPADPEPDEPSNPTDPSDPENPDDPTDPSEPIKKPELTLQPEGVGEEMAWEEGVIE